MESALWQASSFEEFVKPVRHHCAIERITVRSREHQAPFLPSVPGDIPLGILTAAMFAKHLRHRWWHDDRSPASSGLRLDKLEHTIDPLKLPSNPDVTHLEVDIVPTQAQRFALAQAEC